MSFVRKKGGEKIKRDYICPKGIIVHVTKISQLDGFEKINKENRNEKHIT